MGHAAGNANGIGVSWNNLDQPRELSKAHRVMVNFSIFIIDVFNMKEC